MEYKQELSLELNSNAAYTTVGAKQGDNNTRTIQVHLTQNGETYNIPSGVEAYFRFRKPDGKAVVNKATIDNNSIYVVLTSQTLAVPGRGYADITLQNQNEILSSVSFIIIIMSAPQILSQVVSSNEFGYLNDIVSSATNIIQEAEAWATGTRNNVPVFSEDSVITTYSSEAIYIIELNEAKFFAKVGHNPGLKRIYTFTHNSGSWSVVPTIINGANSTTDQSSLVPDLSAYGIEITTYGGVTEFNNGDWIKITVSERDHAYQNNSKYYAELAAASQAAVENLEVTAEKVYAEEFGPYEEYEAGTYVWYNNLLYRFLVKHYPGAWNSEEVVEEIIIDKQTNLEEQVTSLHLRLPQGKTGDVNFMTFEIDMDPISEHNGELMMYKPRKGVEQIDFQIMDTVNPIGPEYEGYLGVSIKTGGGS